MNDHLDRDEYINQLQRLEKIRQDFIANVSHELRTPLTVFHGYLESLIDESKDHPWNKIFLQMQQQSKRMEKLVADLLLLARLESDHIVMDQKQIVNVPAMIKTIAEEARALNNTQNIITDVDDSLQIEGYEKELRSAFSNLVYNAVHYTPDCGKIIITWKKIKDAAIFTVTDTGIGIDQKHIARITERFYRVDKARSRANGGTGLGLAIIKHVLIRHNGELKIQSELGKGSTFSCILPY